MNENITEVSKDSLIMNQTFSKKVGCYVVNDSLRFYLTTKPTKWNRFWTKILIGWKWEDD